MLKVLKANYEKHKSREKRRNAIRISSDEVSLQSSFKKLPVITDSMTNIFSLTEAKSTKSIEKSPRANKSMTI